MSQFVCITGASLPETALSRLAPTGWFSKTCNALGGQIGHIPKDAETAAICCVKGINRVTNPLFTLFLAYFCGFKRHYDPVYGSMT